MTKVLILTDGKAGHENQSKAFARRLNCEFEIARVRFKSRFHKALSYIFDLARINATWLWEFESEIMPEGTPAAVIGTGSGTFYPAKSAAKSFGVKCGVVLYPRGYSLKDLTVFLPRNLTIPRIFPT